MKKNDPHAIMASYHEAGHAVVAILGLIRPTQITIFGKGYKAGETASFVPTFPRTNVKPRGPELFLLHGRLRMLLAGYASEKVFYEKLVGETPPAELKRCASHDFTTYRAIVYKKYAHASVRARLRKKLEGQTTHLVEHHWPVVESLAQAIFEHRKLDYSGIKKGIFAAKSDIGFWKKMFRHLESIALLVEKDCH